MPDFIDQMQEQEERRLAAIERFNQQEALMPIGESASECDECGNPIPKARQLAIRGCRLCIECQSVNEAKAKHRSVL